MTPNTEQQAAIAAILAWLRRPGEPFLVLKGYAGTGKTFSVKHVIREFKGRTVFTAPTNKATKVLRESLREEDYSPECRTIYSLLGLRMEANGEVKELSRPDEKIDLSAYKLVVLDEGSMLNKQVMEYVNITARNFGTKFLLMGDAAQLPPVGELTSPIWKLDCEQAVLNKVMRHDNQILKTVTSIRAKVDHPAPSISISSDNADGEGVWRIPQKDFLGQIAKAAAAGRFSQPDSAKAVAWRNVTVDSLNTHIRSIIFPEDRNAWLSTDRVLFTAPAKDLEDEVVATTDDEGTLTRVEVDTHPLYPEFTVWVLAITLDSGTPVVARVLHPSSQAAFSARSEFLAAEARGNGRKWKTFWEFKEAFHGLRHAYAITAHRSQGSTYDTAFVDTQDILLNRNRQEAFRCLYVAASRPKKQLVMT